jgi:hypothetical protein
LVVFRQKQMPCKTQSRSFVAAPGRRIAGINSQVERIFFQSSASINLIVLLLLYAVFLAITYGVFIYFRRSYITLWPNDVMGLIDIAHRVYVGQVPYKDFQLFYGPLVAFVPALGLALGLQGGAIFGVNALVAAGVVLPAAAVLVGPPFDAAGGRARLRLPLASDRRANGRGASPRRHYLGDVL